VCGGSRVCRRADADAVSNAHSTTVQHRSWPVKQAADTQRPMLSLTQVYSPCYCALKAGADAPSLSLMYTVTPEINAPTTCKPTSASLPLDFAPTCPTHLVQLPSSVSDAQVHGAPGRGEERDVWVGLVQLDLDLHNQAMRSWQGRQSCSDCTNPLLDSYCYPT
jgi:hypothetical protein